MQVNVGSEMPLFTAGRDQSQNSLIDKAVLHVYGPLRLYRWTSTLDKASMPDRLHRRLLSI